MSLVFYLNQFEYGYLIKFKYLQLSSIRNFVINFLVVYKRCPYPEKRYNEQNATIHCISIYTLFHTVQTFNSCTSRPDVCQCLVVQRPIDNMSNNRPSTSMTHVACETKLRSFVRSSMHICPGNVVAIGRAVVYYARAAHIFSAGIKCRHCSF